MSKHRQPNSHGCFICGLANPIGLKMVFYEDRDRNQVRADLTVPETYRSYPGVVLAILIAPILIARHRGYYSCGRRCPHETSGRALMADQNRP